MPYWLKNQDKVLTDKVPFRVVLGNPSCVAMKYNGTPSITWRSTAKVGWRALTSAFNGGT